ncbi:hypothetical protein MTP99_006780 [Tenebrio molitor]|uniref:alpha-tocopherol transfer protein-like n=1 Tax=Tenebrio molitor TaxID=7067 RepID=UPI0026F8BF38|nr:hypothetical protein MTP99_006780 [Tenebrio molitor]
MALFKFEEHVYKSMLQVYDRTEESMKEDVQRLKEWIKTQPHLPEVMDDKRIENLFLLAKCSIEKAKQKIDNYYTIRSLIPEFYDKSNPETFESKQVMEAVYVIPLPMLTKEMYRVNVFKVKNKDIMNILSPCNVAGYEFNMFELRLAEDYMFGDVIIFDVENVGWEYIKKLTPSMCIKNLAPYEKVYSLPLKAIYMINATPMVQTVMNILKGILKQKIFERIHVYQDTSILHERFPKELLPTEYGGTGPSLEELDRIYRGKYVEYKDRFDQLDKLRVDESLRPDPLQNDEILGFHGNFKKLSVD